MTVHAGGTRRENLDRLAEERIDLFWKVVYLLLMMGDRKIRQAELARAAGKSVGWVQSVLNAHPRHSHEALERNIEILDDAITEITELRKG